MRAFPWDCVLQTQGCQAVYGLARNNPNNQRSLATGGACGAVLDALDRFFDSSLELTAAGAEAIMAMAFDDAENQSLLARGGVAEGSRPNARGVCEILTDATGRWVVYRVAWSLLCGSGRNRAFCARLRLALGRVVT